MGAHGKRQRLPFRRRRDGATDYRRRMRLLRSGAPRAVVRISNTRTLCQLVTYDADGDQVLMTVTGSDLVATYGWSESHSRKSVPASYLVGYALGKAATAAGHDEAILDIGLARASPGGRVFAALKGMVDAGLEIPHSEHILPESSRIEGQHISEHLSNDVEQVKNNIEGAF